jgi:two-component system phosphate regulon response regulator PhoB
MTQSATVILTAQNPALLNALDRHRPDLNTMVIGSRIPETYVEGKLWCFVDWVLPDVSGLEMCRHLRSAPVTGQAHITMVLDENDSETRQRALRVGADDYVVGPLTPDRLLERLQRYHAAPVAPRQSPKLMHGDLIIDPAAYQARYRGLSLPLAPNEFRLLVHFVENPNQMFSRKSLIEQVGRVNGPMDERTVDVWVGRLRRTLMALNVPDPLRTVRSQGYVLDSVAPDQCA